jgi:hypothetical protein
MANIKAAARRLQKAQATLRAQKEQRARVCRVRVDVVRPGEPMPAWPEKRPSDTWLVIEVPE